MKKLSILLLAALPALSFAQKVSIIPSFGFAWRTAKIPDGLDSVISDHIKQLKSGYQYDISVYYNITPEIGLGVKYNQYIADASSTVSGFINQTPVTSTITTNDNIYYVGPSVIYSNFNEDTRHKLYYDLSIGYISYKSVTGQVDTTGANLGAAITIGYMYALSPKIFIGPQVAFTGGTLTKMKVDGVSSTLNDEKENLHRVAVSLGLNFRPF